MIRVYLDWNIFSYLRHFKNDKEPFQTLDKNLTRHSDKILIPYSASHLTDLKKSSHSLEGQSELQKDLDYLQSLSKGHCIVYNFLKQSTYPDRLEVSEYYEQMMENEDFHFESFNDLFKGALTPEIGKLNQQLLDLYGSMPSSINPEDLDKLPDKYLFIKDLFSGGSMLDLFNGTVKLMNSYQSDPKVYRSLRNASIEDLKMTFDYSKEADPIKRISDKLERSQVKKSFSEFANEAAKNLFKDKEPRKFDYFTNHYISHHQSHSKRTLM